MLKIVFYIAGSLLTLGYAYVIVRYLVHWRGLPQFAVPAHWEARTPISVLVPARNEAANIGSCIASIVANAYPADLLEIIVINDHSTDETVRIVDRFSQIKRIDLTEVSGKKRALQRGIAAASGDLLITTDADCVVPSNWLRNVVAYHETTGKEFIAAPVLFHQEQSLLERFQSLDFVGTMLLTGGGISGQFAHLCNGANLAYTKKIWQQVGGFEGIDHLASGDDMLLMHKVLQLDKAKIGFLKSTEAVVRTSAMPTWSSFYQQRLRWGTKSAHYSDWRVTAILAVVFLFCVSITLNLLLAWWVPALGIFALLQLWVKFLFDFWLLRTATRFFRREDLLRSFVPAQLLHTLYIVVLGIASNLQKKYQWKGRSLR